MYTPRAKRILVFVISAQAKLDEEARIQEKARLVEKRVEAAAQAELTHLGVASGDRERHISEKKQWEATILFEGWPIEGEDLCDRVRKCIETHPTLSFSTTAVFLGEPRKAPPLWPNYPMHASAPKGMKCTDCSIDQRPCEKCWKACLSTPLAVWSADDPRHYFGKHGNIIVTDGVWSTFGAVETNHGWYVDLHSVMGGRKGVDERDPWPKNWRWTRMPAPPEIKK